MKRLIVIKLNERDYFSLKKATKYRRADIAAEIAVKQFLAKTHRIRMRTFMKSGYRNLSRRKALRFCAPLAEDVTF